MAVKHVGEKVFHLKMLLCYPVFGGNFTRFPEFATTNPYLCNMLGRRSAASTKPCTGKTDISTRQEKKKGVKEMTRISISMRKLASLLLATAVLAGTISGCGTKNPQTSPENTGAAPSKAPVSSEDKLNESKAGEAVDGGTLTISMDKAPTSLDPMKISGYNAYVACQQLGDTLIIHDPEGKGEYLPNLATSWETSDDGLQWVFQLRDDVHFQKGEYQDGRLMTAEDVAYSFMRNKQHVNNTLGFVEKVEATGENEVTFTLYQPTATLLYEITLPNFIIVPQEEAEGWGDEFGAHVISTGAFQLESHEIDQQTVMVRNENYWGARPHLDKVVFKVIQDPNQRLNALITGEIDLALSLSTDSLQQVMDNPDLDLVSLNKVQMNMIAFSYENGPTTDPRVRQALSMATDRQALIDGAFAEGVAKYTKIPLPGNSWAYDDKLQDLVPDYDPEGAKALLAEAGYPDGFQITLSYAASTERDRVGVVLQQMWKENLNVDVVLDATETATYNDKVHSGNGELYMGGITASSPDPAFSLGYSFDSSKAHASYNPGPYINEEWDKLNKKALASTDQEERTGIYHEMLKMAMEDYPGIWFADQYPCWGVRNGTHMTDFDNWFLICNGNTYNAWKEQ